jgi:hypothetical protein
MKNSNFLNLKLSDFWKGLIVAVVTTVLGMAYKLIEAGQFPLTWVVWKPILLAGLGAGIAYVLKNLFTNSTGEVLKSEAK